ncbi:DUF1876 domain-containing protein [Streptomyces sp. NPDC020379]|uniref:DUF1876 domain-containing protein n=1 Tax=Streptomyces sp. NPDC020379 TaxID=3365071 RepID=UPI0037BA5D24
MGPEKPDRSGYARYKDRSATGWVIFGRPGGEAVPSRVLTGSRGRALPAGRGFPDDVAEVVIMQVAGWHVEVEFDEDETRTRAAALLRLRDGTDLRGRGQATRDPRDADERRIGEELAGGRALLDIGQQLMVKAGAEVQNL